MANRNNYTSGNLTGRAVNDTSQLTRTGNTFLQSSQNKWGLHGLQPNKKVAPIKAKTDTGIFGPQTTTTQVGVVGPNTNPAGEPVGKVTIGGGPVGVSVSKTQPDHVMTPLAGTVTIGGKTINYGAPPPKTTTAPPITRDPGPGNFIAGLFMNSGKDRTLYWMNDQGNKSPYTKKDGLYNDWLAAMAKWRDNGKKGGQYKIGGATYYINSNGGLSRLMGVNNI